MATSDDIDGYAESYPNGPSAYQTDFCPMRIQDGLTTHPIDEGLTTSPEGSKDF